MGAAALWWAWTLAHSVPRGDDLSYIDWARREPSVSAIFLSPPPFPGVRPLNAISWWLATHTADVRASAAAAIEAGLWLLAVVTWTGWTRTRAGWVSAAWMAAFLLANPWFRDLPTWRSWMTTTGACAFAGGCLWAFEARRPWTALVLGILGIAFKESAGLLVIAAAWFVYRDRLRALGLGLMLLPGLVKFAGGEGGAGAASWLPADFLGHVGFYVSAIGGSAWLPAGALGAVAAPLAAIGPFGHAAPMALGVLTIVAGIVLAVWSESPWAPVLAATGALPLVYRTENPFYLVEGSILAAGLVAARIGERTLPGWVGVLMVAPAAWSWDASLENAEWQRDQWELANTIIAAREHSSPGVVHVADDAPDGGRFAAFWLQRERGWTVSDDVQPVELCHGVTATE
jgi:hypothetical protein